jgi:glycosyltransferase involved in cell wall biosynthesis
MLLVLSSSNQLYSGTGRVIFETLGRLLDEVDLEVAIDDEDPRNVELARTFCTRHGLALHVGASVRLAGAPDAGNADLAGVMCSEPWDLVMAVSWANAATHRALLEELGKTALAYLPLHQPTWTIPLDDHGREVVESAHRAMLERSDVVLCISPWEQHAVTGLVPGHPPFCAVVAPGCDFSLFEAGPAQRRPDLLFVGDHREPRKRFDRVVRVFERVRARGVDARLVVVGNESERAAAALAPEVAGAVVSLGYVTEEELRRAYRESAVLLLLSEYEAYGLPVIEALASATPVVMTDQPAPRSLYDREDAVHFVDGDDADAVAELVAQLVTDGVLVRQRLAERHGTLAAELNWPIVARRTRDQLLAAWARRARRSAGFLSARSARP